MREEICKKNKVSWPKTLKKWFNVKNKAQDFHADDLRNGGSYEGWINNFSEKEICTIKKSRKTERSSKRSADCLQTNKVDHDLAQAKDVNNYRIFVATWNVGGKSPTNNLNLDDWLHTSPPADIYVLGFQEIVPLNAGNVLGTEDNGPAKKWLALIRKTLNSLPGPTDVFPSPPTFPKPVIELDSEFEKSMTPKPSSVIHRRSFQSLSQSMRLTDSEPTMQHLKTNHRYSICDQAMFGNRPSDYDQIVGSSDEENGPGESPNSID